MNSETNTGGREALARCRRVVVKVGSQLLTRDDGMPDEDRVRMLAEEVAAMVQQSVEPVLVSSGAIAYGRRAMSWGEPRSVAESQMLASVGQALLIEAHRRALAEHNVKVGQVLLTHRDISHRTSYLNASTTLRTLLGNKVVPVINENDAVSHEEIRFGDNDLLAALVAVMVEADLLLLLTLPDGLYDDDPTTSSRARRVERLEADQVLDSGFSVGGKSALGTGGMASKLEAARVAGKGGVTVVIASGQRSEPIRRVLEGQDVGTIITPTRTPMMRKRHWVRYGLKEQGSVTLDEGAATAVQQKGASVLPVGIRAVDGEFQRGDAIAILAEDGRKLGTGLAAYPADELSLIAGRRSGEIEQILGYKYLEVAVHRDDLIVED